MVETSVLLNQAMIRNVRMAFCLASLAVSFEVMLQHVRAEDWHHWRGPHRNGTTSERSGWDGNRWTLSNELWRRKVPDGGSSPLIVGDRVYAFGWENNEEVLLQIELASGKVLARQSYPAPERGRFATGDEGLYGGPSSTPEFDSATGLIFTLGNDGDLRCWNTKDGLKPVWNVTFYDRYQIQQRPKVRRSPLRDYGFTSSPLVIGEELIVEVGANVGTLIGFEKTTGKERWRSEQTGHAGHNGGPIPVEINRVPMVATFAFDGLLITRMDRQNLGKTAAFYPWQTHFAQNIASVSFDGESFYLTSGYDQSKTAKLTLSENQLRKVWESDHYSTICSPVAYGDRLYWACRNLVCLDAKSGELIWQGEETGEAGSCIVTSDERLIVWCANGKLLLVDSAQNSPDQPMVLARHEIPSLSDVWPHVAIANSRLVCRDRSGTLICLGQ